jgi:hypothetical protein
MLFRETSPFLKPGEQTWEPVVEGLTAYFVFGEVLYALQVLGGDRNHCGDCAAPDGQREICPSYPDRDPPKSVNN